MTDPTPLPPEIHQNVGQKALTEAKSIWAWSSTHTAIAVPVATFIAGFVIGKLI